VVGPVLQVRMDIRCSHQVGEEHRRRQMSGSPSAQGIQRVQGLWMAEGM
jgi:hypothetical protein